MAHARKLLLVPISVAATLVAADDCGQQSAAADPEIVPDGWITDYDYKTNPVEYLRLEYQKAETERLNLYAFFYADWCKPCRQIRTKIVRHPRLRQIFNGRRIVMMEMSRVNCLVTSTTGRPGPIDFVPMLVKVNPDGSLGAGIEPDQWSESPISVTIRKITEFFNRNDEL